MHTDAGGVTLQLALLQKQQQQKQQQQQLEKEGDYYRMGELVVEQIDTSGVVVKPESQLDGL